MLLARIKNGEYEFPDRDWKEISPEAIDLIKQLLVRDVGKRLSAQQVLQHPWITSELPDTLLATPTVLSRYSSNLIGVPFQLSIACSMRETWERG